MSHSDQEDDDHSPELISFIKRQLNILNEEELVKRKEAITSIHERLLKEKFSISGMISQQIMLKFDKALLKAFSDPSEKIRETAIIILEELLSRCDDMTPFLPYILSVLYERTNCHDLEGILSLPEVMRPPPSQKPQALVKLVEKSEEVRIKLCELISVIITCNNENILRAYLDDIVNILRALAMDPCPEVQRAACQNISQFARNNQELLLHFSETLSRALLLSLVSKKSKVRIAGIEALGQILYCGCWKYNANIFEILVGYRDPNYVPIKDFYQASHKINYLALLINDPRVAVRDMFIRSLGDWIANLPDKFDHHPRMLPYILSGLFDYYEEIREVAYETIEECGMELEKEKEKEFRDQKQYGIDSAWTQGGKLANLPLPPPFKKRPCLGARIFIRSHVRKFWHALYKEIKDWNIESRKKASSLFLVSVVYVEDWITQFLYEFIPNLISCIVPQQKEDITVAEDVCKIFELIGRFCDFESYFPIITSMLKGQYSMNPESLRYAIKALNQILKGSLEATVPEADLGKKVDHLKLVLDFVGQTEYLDSISGYNVNEAEELLLTLMDFLSKLRKGEDANAIFKIYMASIIKNETIICYVKNIEKKLLTVKLMDFSSSSDLVDTLKENKPSLRLNDLLKEFSQEGTFDSNLNELEAEAKKLKDVVTDVDWEWKFLYTNVLLRLSLNKLSQQTVETTKLFASLTNTTRTPESISTISKLANVLTFLYVNRESTWTLSGLSDSIPFLNELINLRSCITNWFVETPKKLNSEYLEFYFKNVQVFLTKLLDVASNPRVNEDFDRALSVKSSIASSLSNIIWFLIEGFSKEYSKKKSDIIMMLLVIMRSLKGWAKKLMKKNENPGVFLLSDVIKDQEKFVLPKLFDFCMDRMETLIEIPEAHKINLFELFDLVLEYIPDIENNIYFGEEAVIKDYKKYLSTLIKNFIDESDFEAKKQLKNYLIKLCKKTSMNFKIEIEAADYNKQFGRLAGLKEVIQDSFSEVN